MSGSTSYTKNVIRIIKICVSLRSEQKWVYDSIFHLYLFANQTDKGEGNEIILSQNQL